MWGSYCPLGPCVFTVTITESKVELLVALIATLDNMFCVFMWAELLFIIKAEKQSFKKMPKHMWNRGTTTPCVL